MIFSFDCFVGVCGLVLLKCSICPKQHSYDGIYTPEMQINKDEIEPSN